MKNECFSSKTFVFMMPTDAAERTIYRHSRMRMRHIRRMGRLQPEHGKAFAFLTFARAGGRVERATEPGCARFCEIQAGIDRVQLAKQPGFAGPRALPLEAGRVLPCTHQRPRAFEIPFLNEGVGIEHSQGFPKGKPFGGFSKGKALGSARQRLS
jgi:hypothetical protein